VRRVIGLAQMMMHIGIAVCAEGCIEANKGAPYFDSLKRRQRLTVQAHVRDRSMENTDGVRRRQNDSPSLIENKGSSIGVDSEKSLIRVLEVL